MRVFIDQTVDTWIEKVAPGNLARLSALLDRPLESRGVVEPRAMMPPRSGRLGLAHFAVSGLGELGHLRRALPAELVEPRRGADGAAQPAAAALENVLLDAPVSFTAEVGNTAIELGRLSELSVGDVIELEAPSDGLLTARIDGAAKFRATRGSVDQRLAVRLVGHATAKGEEGDGQPAKN